jgi:hypothetical protein
MNIHSRLLATTAISVRPFVSFDTGPIAPNSFPPALPGTVNVGLIQSLLNAAQAVAGQSASTDIDLGARASDMNANIPYWDTSDDIVAGYDAIKAGGTKYLPKFPDETTDEYQYRLECGEFTNIFRDIVEVLASKPFEEEIKFVETTGTDANTQVPQQIKDFVENVDGAGNNLTTYAATTFFNGIASAIDWIFIDYPIVDNSVIKTQADLTNAGIKPFWTHVLGRNVLEATTAVVNGNEELIKVRILEPGKPNYIRMFEKDVKTGLVNWALFEEKISADGRSKTYILIDSGLITIGVIPLVPFVTGRRDGRTFKLYPPMRDAADLQIQLYKQESGLNFTKIMAAYPMLAANGIKPEKGPDGKPLKLRVGPNRVLYCEPSGDGKVGHWAYVSPDAALMTFLAADVKATIEELRELGRVPLTAQSGNLTVITTAFATGKSKTAVGAWGQRLKKTLEIALEITAKWLNIADFKAQLDIYDEYDDFADQGVDQQTLVSARTNRDISRVAFLKELKRRNILMPEFDIEADVKELLKETPDDSDTADDDGAGGVQPKTPGTPAPKPQPAQPEKK